MEIKASKQDPKPELREQKDAFTPSPSGFLVPPPPHTLSRQRAPDPAARSRISDMLYVSCSLRPCHPQCLALMDKRRQIHYCQMDPRQVQRRENANVFCYDTLGEPPLQRKDFIKGLSHSFSPLPELALVHSWHIITA